MKWPPRALRPWRWALPAGLVALGLTALLAGGVTPHWAASATQAEAEVRALRVERAAAAQRAAGAAATERAWPVAARAGDRTADLLEHALRSGVEIQSTQQRVDRVPNASLELLRLQQPVRGSYADLRRLVGVSLAGDASLGLERLRLQRTASTAREFDGELQWTMVQAPPGPKR